MGDGLWDGWCVPTLSSFSRYRMRWMNVCINRWMTMITNLKKLKYLYTLPQIFLNRITNKEMNLWSDVIYNKLEKNEIYLWIYQSEYHILSIISIYISITYLSLYNNRWNQIHQISMDTYSHRIMEKYINIHVCIKKN